MGDLSIRLSDATGVPFYRQIVDQVADLIRSGQLAPSEQLPSVRDLAGQLLVSLITTRRAYQDLEHQGLIVRRQGHGTFVSEEVQSASREQAEAEARAVLEAAVGRALRLGIGVGDVRRTVDQILNTGGH